MQYGNASRYGSVTSEQIGVSYHYVSLEDFETLREQVDKKWWFLCFLYIKWQLWKFAKFSCILESFYVESCERSSCFWEYSWVLLLLLINWIEISQLSALINFCRDCSSKHANCMVISLVYRGKQLKMWRSKD